MLLSGSALQTVARGEILDLVNRAVQMGYMAGLKDVQNGVRDDGLLTWRPHLAER